jgi:hypothetical protein
MGVPIFHHCKACEDAIKDAIIRDHEKLETKDVLKLLAERRRYLNTEANN